MQALLPLFLAAMASAQSWIAQTSNTTASLRGASAVDSRTVWASGTGGTYVVTTDGGDHWTAAHVPGAESLDFRGIRAIDARTVFLMSAGNGGQARLYKTSDAGAHWQLLFTNPDAKGFFDAIGFWDAAHGIVLGDPVDGQFAIFTTDDGGAHWQRQHTPPALPNEGAFAASNSCLVLRGKREAWFGTGGPAGARVFRSTDRGRSWSVAATPMVPLPASSPSPFPIRATASPSAATTPKTKRTARTLPSPPMAAAPGLPPTDPGRAASAPPSSISARKSYGWPPVRRVRTYLPARANPGRCSTTALTTR